jgi:hypothetical protein
MGKLSVFFSQSSFLFSFLFSFLLTNTLLGQSTISINEIMASNQSTIADEDEEFADWIELYNYGDDQINMGGWGLTDNYERLFKWVFPNITIQPQEFLLVWASGKDRKQIPSPMETFISDKSEWKFLDDGSNQGTAWREPGFDDSSWASGPAMLGYDTNNNTEFGTEISYGGNASYKHVTYYFRKNFEIENAENYQELELKLMIDDGAVVYINGQEIIRKNMPTGTISYTTFANVIVLTLDISYHIIDPSYLVNGTNSIAVEVHQCNRTSSDLRFDMELYSRARYLHTNFSISSDGEEILLTHPEFGLIDSVPPQKLPSNVSIGRWPDGSGDFYYYAPATPGMPNSEERYSELLEPPVFSHQAGFYGSPFDLEITASDPDVQIIYTLDGSDPDPDNLEGTSFPYKNSFPGSFLSESYKSIGYTGPIYIQDRTPSPEYISTFATNYNGARYTSSNRLFKGTVIRARAVKDGAVPSPEVAQTFFVTSQLHNRYTLPVLSLTTQANSLFDYYTGIYTPGVIWEEQGNGNRNGGAPANYHESGREWEKSAWLEFFDGDPTNPVISQNVGIRMHGGWSRALPMKSIRIYSRGSYGDDYFNHRIFPDLPYERYKRILLRNSGNDWGSTMFRDAAIQAVLGELRCDFQAYRPAILFINGEYWGIHNIRERYDKYYLNRTYGVDPENIDLLEIVPNSDAIPKQGDINHYVELTRFLSTRNMSLANNYIDVQALMDVDNFMDFQIGQIYAANTDWPGNNNDFWRLRTDGYQKYAPYGHDGRWRWMLFDTDFGFNLYNSASHNTLSFATAASGPSWPNPPHSTLILRRLLLNEQFRHQFINRFADLLNTHFHPDRVKAIINQMRDDLEPEMAEHISRWGRPGSITGWQNDVNGMNTFADQRPGYMRQFIRNQFSLSGITNLTVDVSNPMHGYVKLNSLEIVPGGIGLSLNPYPWSGVYFQGVPIQLEAIPVPGYVFSHWEGLEKASSPFVFQAFTQNSASVKAHFKPGHTLYSWNFNDLPQDNFSSIHSDHSGGSQGLITYEGEGDGYMDRVNEGTLLNATGGTPAGFGLRVRNPSADRELIIDAPTTGFKNISFSYATMRTTNGAEIQEIQYRTSLDGDWQVLVDVVHVEEEWKILRFGFPADADNNQDFALKILFKGEQATGESGNNRFDNIRIEGLDISVSVNDDGIENEAGILENKINLWYNNEMLYLDYPYQGNSNLIIYNISGMFVAKYTISGNGHHKLYFSEKNGLYIARITGNGMSNSMRFLVVNP